MEIYTLLRRGRKQAIYTQFHVKHYQATDATTNDGICNKLCYVVVVVIIDIDNNDDDNGNRH